MANAAACQVVHAGFDSRPLHFCNFLLQRYKNIFIDPFCGSGGFKFTFMAKAKKSAKEASDIFHQIIAASVKGNPKPAPKKKADKKK
jgi:hypothetical protein